MQLEDSRSQSKYLNPCWQVKDLDVFHNSWIYLTWSLESKPVNGRYLSAFLPLFPLSISNSCIQFLNMVTSCSRIQDPVKTSFSVLDSLVLKSTFSHKDLPILLSFYYWFPCSWVWLNGWSLLKSLFLYYLSFAELCWTMYVRWVGQMDIATPFP